MGAIIWSERWQQSITPIPLVYPVPYALDSSVVALGAGQGELEGRMILAEPGKKVVFRLEASIWATIASAMS